MRWEQAKLVLIATFFCLDLFLGWRLIAQTGGIAAPLPSQALYQPTRVGSSHLQDVQVDGVLPGAPAALPALTVRLRPQNLLALAKHLFGPDFREERQGQLVSFVGPAGTLQEIDGALLFQRASRSGRRTMDRSLAQAAATAFLGQMGNLPTGAVFDRARYDAGADAWDVSFVQRYQGQPLYAGRCVVQVDQYGIRGATCYWLDAVGPAGPPHPILSAADALQRLAEQEGARPAQPLIVRAIGLGYVSAAYEPNATWPTVPVWRVEVADGSLYYVNAYTGTLVQGPH